MMQFSNLSDAQTLALAIVDTLPEPFVVLDDELCVVAASRCFCDFFQEDAEHIRGRPFFELGEGQWDIPKLRVLIETIIPEQTTMNGFEVEQEFLHIGRRILVLNARMVRYEQGTSATILLAFKDITHSRAIELEKQKLLEHTKQLLAEQKTLLREMEHRIANSLQMIASILLLKARGVASEETRHELQDAHQRVMSVAAVQRHLHAVNGIEQIDVAAYLAKLTESLAASMIGPQHAIEIEVRADEGTLPTNHAVSLGLIVTELVINAIKYAFPASRAGARIVVAFEHEGPHWLLSVSDNGVGRSGSVQTPTGGLGTAIVASLASQLQAEINEVSSAKGLRVEVAHAMAATELPIAA